MTWVPADRLGRKACFHCRRKRAACAMLKHMPICDAHAHNEQIEWRSLRAEPKCGRENNQEFRFKFKCK